MTKKLTTYQHVLESVLERKKLLAVLIDPDKIKLEDVPLFIEKINNSLATHIFIGGSTVKDHVTEVLVVKIKTHSKLPIVIFPGDLSQISNQADALLFLSLLSGRNPDYLIDKHVASISKLRGSQLEIIPTGYILIENGKETAVQKVTNTKPMSKSNIQKIVDTAKAGELLGMKLIYLEAGSGAMQPIPSKIINRVKNDLNIPLIVGGGIKTRETLKEAYQAGADLVVIGTAFENDESFFDDLKI